MINWIKFSIISFLTSFLFASSKYSFFTAKQIGANVFAPAFSEPDIEAAKNCGLKFIRLAPDKFASRSRDFLIGNADQYDGLVEEDLNYLKLILDICEEKNVRVVITMLSLPGSRWKQHNNDLDDLRIWSDPIYQSQAARFWADLAHELKDHPAAIGYNILNEPHPEKCAEIAQADMPEIMFNFYELVIQSIRQVDPNTPIILDSSDHADPQAFKHFKVHTDPYIIYSFHMYEPFSYTNKELNAGKFTYPGCKINGKTWNKEALEEYIKPVHDFQKKYNVPILVGEFGGHRDMPGLDQYFTDVISICASKDWPMAFYAFRDDWDGMDYTKNESLRSRLNELLGLNL